MNRHLLLMILAGVCLDWDVQVEAEMLSLTDAHGQWTVETPETNLATKSCGLIADGFDDHPIVNSYGTNDIATIHEGDTQNVLGRLNGVIPTRLIGATNEVCCVEYLPVFHARSDDFDRQDGVRAAVWQMVLPTTDHSFKIDSGDVTSSAFAKEMPDRALSHGRSFPAKDFVVGISPDCIDCRPYQALNTKSLTEPLTLALLFLDAIGFSIGAYGVSRACIH